MSKKTLNQTNLEALGAPQLAALLLEVSTGSAEIKRRLRLELSHNLGVAELVHDVRKRLASIDKSKSYVSWRKRKSLVRDLDTQLRMIVGKIAPTDPTAAFDLLWQFIEMAPSVHDRVDDSKGEIGAVFRSAAEQLDDLAPRAALDPAALADRIWTALQDNRHGEWDGIITGMAPALGAIGLARLKSLVEAFAAQAPAPATHEHEALRFLRELRGGDSAASEARSRFVKACLQEIAAATGDTEGYIAQYSTEDLKRPGTAAEVARILLDQGAAAEAIDLLRAAESGADDRGQIAWDAAYIACLTALDRVEAAQAHRWACFEAGLSIDHLRDYLRLLPDFEDVEAEDRAKRHALAFPDVTVAVQFLVDWPDIHLAAQLIESRSSEIDGNRFDVLPAAAEQLRARYPRAASLLWRAMINHALKGDQAFRYGAAAEHLRDCASVDPEITDYGPFGSHDRYLAALRERHGRKTSFWSKVG